MKRILVLSLLATGLSGCIEPPNTAAVKEQRATEILANQAATVVGMPAIKLFTEKRQLKTIYELRDTANLVTYSYTIDMNGKRHRVCPTTSIGFGIPYSTQYTSPRAVQRYYLPATETQYKDFGTFEADQPEPNGLHMPSSADGTWVLCLHPDGKTLAPTYVEPLVAVYLFEMPSE
jgi:hypothetical protein